LGTGADFYHLPCPVAAIALAIVAIFAEPLREILSLMHEPPAVYAQTSSFNAFLPASSALRTFNKNADLLVVHLTPLFFNLRENGGRKGERTREEKNPA